jgi:hypothetical protein
LILILLISGLFESPCGPISLHICIILVVTLVFCCCYCCCCCCCSCCSGCCCCHFSHCIEAHKHSGCCANASTCLTVCISTSGHIHHIHECSGHMVSIPPTFGISSVIFYQWRTLWVIQRGKTAAGHLPCRRLPRKAFSGVAACRASVLMIL